jgi:hypothetical protein
MMTKQQFFLALLILLILVFTAGILVGRWSKQCPIVIAATKSSDTTETYVPITIGAGSPLTVISKPANAPYIPHIQNKTKLHQLKSPVNSVFEIPHISPQNKETFKDSCKELCQEPITFTAKDTIRFDSLYVAISDTGNCKGIITRHSVFGGKIKEKTITNTITQVVQYPTPVFQLNAGVQSSFTNQWQVRDIGPAVHLQLKQKFTVGYTYMVNSQTHNISLLTKIK